MLDVIIGLLPALVFSVWNFGIGALTVTAVSVAACLVWEWLYRTLLKKPQSIGDLSAVVTGILIAFVSPVTIPLWMLIIGDFFAIIVVKQLFGGIGKNFVNPALAGRAFLLGSYAAAMTHLVDPAANKVGLLGAGADVITAATPLAFMKGSGEIVASGFQTLSATYTIADMVPF